MAISDISLNYEKLLGLTHEEAFRIAKINNGYAYAYQVAGYILEKYNTKDFNLDLEMELVSIFSSQVYEKVFSKLSNNEKRIIIAFDDQEESTALDLLEKTKIDVKQFSVYRNRLIQKGALTSKGRACLNLLSLDSINSFCYFNNYYYLNIKIEDSIFG